MVDFTLSIDMKDVERVLGDGHLRKKFVLSLFSEKEGSLFVPIGTVFFSTFKVDRGLFYVQHKR